MSAPVNVDELDQRVPGTHMPKILKALQIEWPTRDLDVEEQEAYGAFLERVKKALAASDSGPASTATMPRQLSTADAEVLRPMVAQLKAAAPDLDFSFFAPFEPDAAGSIDA